MAVTTKSAHSSLLPCTAQAFMCDSPAKADSPPPTPPLPYWVKGLEKLKSKYLPKGFLNMSTRPQTAF